MPRLKRLSGEELTRIFGRFGFSVVKQEGSHMKLRRIMPDGARQTLTVSSHKELDSGTCRAIFKQAAKYVSEEELRPHFYSS